MLIARKAGFESRGSMTLRRVASNAAALAAGGIVAQICFVTIEALIARSLGAEAYGIYGAVAALALTVVIFADGGMSIFLIEQGSRDRARLPWLFGTTAAMKLVLCAAVYPAALLVLPLVGYPPELVAFFAIYFGYVAIGTQQDTFAAVYTAEQRMHVNALFQGATPLAVLAAVAIATRYSPTLASIGVAYIAGAAVVTAVWSIKAVREGRPSIEPARVREVARGSYHYGITFALYEMLLRVDVMMLALWRELGEVGLYTACYKLADLGLKAGTMTTRVMTPVLYEQSASAPDQYRRTCKVVLRGMSVLAVSGCLVLALTAEPVLTLVFGPPFAAASTVLVLLALSLVVRLVASMLLIVLSASGEHGRRTGALGAGVAVAATANAALIPAYGMIGAAIARTVGDCVYLGWMLSARRLPFPRLHAFRWVLAPIAAGAAAYALAVNLPVHFLLQLAAGLALYAVVLLGSRTLDLRELAALARGRAFR